MTDTDTGLKKVGAWVGIVAGVVGLLAILIGPALLLNSVDNQLETLSGEVRALRVDVRELREERWTRGDQLTWERDEFAPLEARVRALEVAP